jgi:hypothetical protein
MSTLRPPKNCGHKYNFFIISFFCNVWTLYLGFFFKLYLVNLKLNLINFLKKSENNENFECMEYICDKIIPDTKFEKNAYRLQN